jgi:hypothetical protein
MLELVDCIFLKRKRVYVPFQESKDEAMHLMEKLKPFLRVGIEIVRT